MKNKIVIGLTGKNASGKGEAAKYLISKGFKYYSLSDVIREGLLKLRREPTRDNMIEFGNRMRKRYGAGVLAGKIKKLLKGNSIVDSIRNISEIKELRKMNKFFLIGVDAPVALRFKRLNKRGRIGDAKTLNGFILKEKKEDSSVSTSQQLSRCLQEADKIMINKGSLGELHKKLDKVLKEIK